MKVPIKCPYCGMEDHREYSTTVWLPHVETCDCEKGGCDRHFAVTVQFKAEVKTFSIEPKAVE